MKFLQLYIKISLYVYELKNVQDAWVNLTEISRCENKIPGLQRPRRKNDRKKLVYAMNEGASL